MIYLPPCNDYTAGLDVSQLFLHQKSPQLTYLAANNLLSDQRGIETYDLRVTRSDLYNVILTSL